MYGQKGEHNTDNTDLVGDFVELLFKWSGLWALLGGLEDLSESTVFSNDESEVSALTRSATGSGEDDWG